MELHLTLRTNHIKASKYKPLPFSVALVTFPPSTQDVPPDTDPSEAKNCHLSVPGTVKILLQRTTEKLQMCIIINESYSDLI